MSLLNFLKILFENDCLFYWITTHLRLVVFGEEWDELNQLEIIMTIRLINSQMTDYGRLIQKLSINFQFLFSDIFRTFDFTFQNVRKAIFLNLISPLNEIKWEMSFHSLFDEYPANIKKWVISEQLHNIFHSFIKNKRSDVIFFFFTQSLRSDRIGFWSALIYYVNVCWFGGFIIKYY